MYNTSAGYDSSITALYREIDVLADLTTAGGTTYTLGVNQIQSMKVIDPITDSNVIRIGTCVASTLEMKIVNFDGFLTGVDLNNAVVIPRTGVKVAGSYEYVPAGKFYLRTDIDRKNENLISVKGMDGSYKLDAPFDESGVAYPITIKNLIINVLNQAGITYDTTGLDSLINSAIQVEQAFSIDTNLRNMLQYLLEACGCCGKMNRSGVMVFKYVNNSTTSKVFDEDKYTGIEKSDFTIAKINKLTIKTEENDLGVTLSRDINRFNPATVTASRYLTNTGTLATDSAWSLSDYIPVSQLTQYTYQGLTTVGSAPYSVYYNASMTMISSFKQAIGTNTITTPANCAYVRFSILNSNVSTFQIRLANVGTPVEYDIINNPVLYDRPERFLDGILTALEARALYSPAKIPIQGRPEFDSGDVVTANINGTSYLLPICVHTLNFNGALSSTFESVGESLTDGSKIVGSVKTEIRALKKKSNVLSQTLDETRSTITQIQSTQTDMQTNITDISQKYDSISVDVTNIEQQKRQVFVAQPVPPYAIGDLWTEGPTGDLKRCKTAKLVGQTYDAADWEIAVKYTDNSSLEEFVAGTYTNKINDLQGQIDGSITTWFYQVPPALDNPPANTWTTTDLENIHLGDLYYDTITGYCYRWQVQNNQYSWVRLTDTDVTKALSDASKAQDTADNKRRVFVATPTPPYDIGDLWTAGASGDLKRCKTAKLLGQSFLDADWELATKYTDDTAVNNLQIGGRNLVLDSSFKNGFKYWIGNGISVIDASTFRNTKVMKLPSTTANYADVSQGISNLEGGKTYTISLWAKGDVAQTGVFLHAVEHTESGLVSPYIDHTQLFRVDTAWVRIQYTITLDTTARAVFLYIRTYSGDVAYVAQVKVESGNKATDWTPAPEDVDNSISDSILNIQVGGRNLLKNGATQYYSNTDYTNNTTNTTGRMECKASGPFNNYRLLNSTEFPARLDMFADAGAEYTFSIDVYAHLQNAATKMTMIWDIRTPGYYPFYATFGDTGGKWIRVSCTAKIVAGQSTTIIGFITMDQNHSITSGTTGDYLLYKNAKIEKGNKATDWTPAPEEVTDAYTAVAQAKADLAQTQAQAYADGQVTAEEQARINEAAAKLAEAKTYAEGQAAAIQVGARNLLLGTADERTVDRNYDFAISTGFPAGQYVYSFWLKANRATTANVYLNDDTGQQRVYWGMQPINVTTSYQKFVIPFTLSTTDGVSTNSIKMRIYAAAGDILTGKQSKLEKGNKATDWTLAPEDVQAIIDALNAYTNDAISTVTVKYNEAISITKGQILNTVSQVYTTKSEVDEKIQKTQSDFQQTFDGFDWRITQAQSAADANGTDLASMFAELQMYMRYVNGVLELGQSNNTMTLKLTPTKISFYIGNAEAAYFSNNKLYITQAEILTNLVIGKFAFEPRQNGNMSLKYKG
jgi:hypothetical protein